MNEDLICQYCGRNLTEECMEEDYSECFECCIDCVAEGRPPLEKFDECESLAN